MNIEKQLDKIQSSISKIDGTPEQRKFAIEMLQHSLEQKLDKIESENRLINALRFITTDNEAISIVNINDPKSNSTRGWNGYYIKVRQGYYNDKTSLWFKIQPSHHIDNNNTLRNLEEYITEYSIKQNEGEEMSKIA
jgi:hypothetical protein